MKLKYTIPLIGFVVPPLVIGYGFVIPNSAIAGVNQLSVGFGTTVLGACLAYFAGIHLVMKDPPSA
jgi:ABC-type Fe3+ transport system permease subunit